MIVLLYQLLILVVIASLLWWVIGEIVPTPFVKVARVVLAVFVVIVLLDMMIGLPFVSSDLRPWRPGWR